MVSVSEDVTDEVADGDLVFITLCLISKENLSAKVEPSPEEEPDEPDEPEEELLFKVAS